MLNGALYEYETGTAEHLRFVRALRTGMRGMSDAERSRVKLASEDALTEQMKAMSQADDTTGGYLSSSEFANDILRQMVDASPVRRVARVVLMGANVGPSELIPVRAGVQTAKRISEVATRVQTTADLAFRFEDVPTHEMYADTAVSRFLLSDSRYPLDAELRGAFVSAASLLEGKEFVSGTGHGEMQGLDVATLPTANVINCADSSGHLVGIDDLFKLLYQSLKAVYLPGATLLLNPKLLGTLRMLKASSGNTYLAPVQDTPGTFLGIPYALLPDMPDNATPAAGRAVAYLLHPLAYTVVVRQELVVQRLTEVYAEQGKVAFYIWQRTGGQVVAPEAVARLVTA